MRIVSLLLAVLLIHFSYICSAQNYDLQLLNTVMPTNVVMGSMVPVNGNIRNNGPETFYADSGKITMNVHASYTAIPPTDTFDLLPITTFDIEVDSIAKNQVVTYNGEFLADNYYFRTGHTGITVIIWPKLPPGADTLIPNHYFTTVVNSTDSASVTSIEGDLEAALVKVYPNPATEWVQIDMPEPRNGVISLINLEGQQVASMPVDKSTVSYLWPLSGYDLTTGIYMLSFEGKDLNWSKKLIIRKH